MIYIARKKIKGKIYLYLEGRAWIDGRSRRTWQKYIGPEEKIEDLQISALFSKTSSKIELKTMEFGISAALWQIASEIGLARTIDKVTKKSRIQNLSLGEYITIAVINRCVAPCSKSKLAEWFTRDWLSTRYSIDPEILNAQTYWNHFQYLEEEILATIELTLGRIVVEKFDLDLDSLFFDPTNFYTFSQGGENSKLLQFGHSKENRNGLRIVNYSLLCARNSGVPLMHETYPGNTQDARAFKDVPGRVTRRLKDLGRDPRKITIVFDKGNHSPEAFAIIDREDLGFIASARNSTQKDLLHVPRMDFTKTVLPVTGKPIEYYRTSRKIYEVERTIFVVLDPAKHRKQVNVFRDKVNARIQEIKDYFQERLNKKKWRKKEAVEKKLKEMVGKNPLARIILATVQGPEGRMILHVILDQDARAQHEQTLGRTILFTNRGKWAPEDVIWGYREQYIVEQAFRDMKSPTMIAIRPMYHHSDTCIRAHVFTCVLALLLLSLLRLKLARKQVQGSYEEILSALREIHVNEIHFSQKAPSILKLDKIQGLARKIVKVFGLKHLIKN